MKQTDEAAMRRVPTLSSDGVTILLFHGVCPEDDYGIRNYTGKHIGAKTFRVILQRLLGQGSALPLDAACAGVRGDDRLRPNTFCVTFDDGFRNNMSIALPILEELEVPATIYVTTDFIETNCPSWVDLIEAAVAGTRRVSVSPPSPMKGTYPLASRPDRVTFMTAVRRIIKASPSTDPLDFAQALTATLIDGHESPRFEPVLDDKLSWAELEVLGAHELVSIGGHAKTHRPLGFLDDHEECQEIALCSRDLGDRDHSWATHFSYPEGFVGSFSDRTVRTLSSMGWQSAVTTIPGANFPGQEVFRLRRYLIA